MLSNSVDLLNNFFLLQIISSFSFTSFNILYIVIYYSVPDYFNILILWVWLCYFCLFFLSLAFQWELVNVCAWKFKLWARVSYNFNLEVPGGLSRRWFYKRWYILALREHYQHITLNWTLILRGFWITELYEIWVINIFRADLFPCTQSHIPRSYLHSR